MTLPRSPLHFSARLLACFGTLALAGAIGLVSSRPAHTAGGPIAVTVANTPLATTAAADPAKQPFTAQTIYVFADGSENGSPDTASGYKDIAVPAGKRLVIQTIGLYHPFYVAETMQVFIAPITNAVGNDFALPPLAGNGTSYLGVAQSVTLYADPGSTVSFIAYRSQSGGPDFLTLTVSGYLVDTP